MLVWVRKLLENWIARGFFALLVMVFVFWGISNVASLVGSNTAVDGGVSGSGKGGSAPSVVMWIGYPSSTGMARRTPRYARAGP